jgi:general secretion pathway protein K
MSRVAPPAGERGMALLTVLLLVAVMGAMTAATLETMNRSMRTAANGRLAMQARYAALGSEAFALRRLDALVGGRETLTLDGGWLGRDFVVPTGDGRVTVRLADGGNCFNLNSVADGGAAATLRLRLRGVLQFVALQTALGVAEADARRIAFALADWIDADAVPLPLGGEDETYRALAVPYRTANTLLAEPSELRAIAGVTPGIYEVLRPWVCTLPTTDMSPINVNTLAPEEAPLLAMVLPGRLDVETARRIIAQRPPRGWTDLAQFWQQPALAQFEPSSEELEQPKLTTRYFNAEILVEQAGYTATETALLDVARGKSSVVGRRWTVAE